MAKRLAVLTTGRQDFGILRSTLHALAGHPAFELLLWAGGTHCSERHGRTVELIRADGLRVDREFATIGAESDPAFEAARTIDAVTAALRADRPDALLLVGDRTETAAAGLAAAIAGVPIVHLHGGEETEGAVDNALRHGLTKFAHLHLVSHELHAERVVQMGEAPEDVIVVGPPGADNLHRTDLPSRLALGRELGIMLRDPVLLVTLHPTTLGGDPTAEAKALAAALDTVTATMVVTQPNADAGSDAIRRVWAAWAPRHQNAVVVEALGERRYWALLRLAAAVVGNSSSGLIEAPAARVPAINIGDRQRGRLRPGGVVDVPAERDAIAATLGAVLARGLPADPTHAPCYPEGLAAPRIVAALEAWTIPQPARKRFVRIPCAISC